MMLAAGSAGDIGLAFALAAVGEPGALEDSLGRPSTEDRRHAATSATTADIAIKARRAAPRSLRSTTPCNV
jgi:hypothetical protein